jgi:hypothetical protein
MTFKINDHVKIEAIPDWLTHDLPSDEREQILGCVGRIMIVESIDSAGYLWVGFGAIELKEDISLYQGHSFAIPHDCVSLAIP